MIRPIKRYGEPLLHRPADSVDAVTPEIGALIDDMIETMYAAPGIGLAAPQIGVDLRIFVTDVSSGRNADDLVVMINPEIVAAEGIQNREEGCLSLPGFEAVVPRPERTVVRGLDRDGCIREVAGTGLTARAFQHELDHLDGRLFVDRLRGLKRELIVRRIKKLRRSGKW
ncbi:MAG: peptide deformylase [Acidobacteria bacterium]|nr:peptide deformylase [Acidobacteriota bacterium]